MPTRNVVLTDAQSELVDRLVASGRFQNASEALRAGSACSKSRTPSAKPCEPGFMPEWKRPA